MTRHYTRACTAAFVLGIGACVGGESGDGQSTNGSGEVAELILEMTIGDDGSGAAEYQFASIASTVFDHAEKSWVLDGTRTMGGMGSPALRQYDSTGKYIRQVGRSGSGPGEYVVPYAIAMLRDGRVALRDGRLPNRLTLYTSDGEVDTTWILDPPRFWIIGGIYPLQVDTGGIIWLPFHDPPRPGPNRRTLFLRMRPDGTAIDTIVPPPAPAVENNNIRITRTLPGGGISIRGVVVPYQPRGHWTWSPFGTFAVARGDEYRIEIQPPPTPLTETPASDEVTAKPIVVTRDIPAVAVAPAEQAAGRSQVADELASLRAGGIAVPDMATHKPPIRGIRFSEDGRLLVWVSMPSENRDGRWAEPNAYDVFDPQGQFLGRMVFPESFYLQGMRGDHVWGMYRGEYDVEAVRRYRVIWPGSSGKASSRADSPG